MSEPVIAVIMTCYNRKQKTLACLRTLMNQTSRRPYELRTFVVDDKSPDNTGDAIRAEFPAVKVIMGTGSLFWNRGMRLAYEHAVQEDPEYLLWLNDDVALFPDAIDRLLAASEQIPNACVVASIQDPTTGRWTYGGWVRPRWLRPSWYEAVLPGDEPRDCDTVNGNCLLVPKSVWQKLGNLEPRFSHAMGDFDYGLRAKQAGLRNIVPVGYFGTCTRNPVSETVLDRSLPLRDRIRRMLSPKGAPPIEWLVFVRRHAGPFWPVFWVSPYVKLLLRRRLPSPQRGS